MKNSTKLVFVLALVALLAIFCVGTAFAEEAPVATEPEKATQSEINELVALTKTDLGGKLYEIDKLLIEAGETASFKNGYIVDTDSGKNNSTIVNYGTLTLEDVTVRGQGIVIYNLGVLEIKGNSVIGGSATDNLASVSVYTGVNAATENMPSTKLTSGTYFGSIVVESGYLASVEISGGTYHGDVECANTTANFTVTAGNFDGTFHNLSDFVKAFSENENVRFSESAMALNPLSAGSYRWNGVGEDGYSNVIKVTGSGSSSTENEQGWFSKYGTYIVMGVFIIGMIVFMVISQRKQKQKEQEKYVALQVGSTITTIGGIVGKVVELTDSTMTIETGLDDEKRTMKLVRQALHSVRPADEPAQAETEQTSAEAEDDTVEDEIK